MKQSPRINKSSMLITKTLTTCTLYPALPTIVILLNESPKHAKKQTYAFWMTATSPTENPFPVSIFMYVVLKTHWRIKQIEFY